LLLSTMMFASWCLRSVRDFARLFDACRIDASPSRASSPER
jgi:hypothetical protein